MKYKLLATALLAVFATNAQADRYATYTDLNGYQLTEGRNERSDLKKQIKRAIKQGKRNVSVSVSAGSISAFDLQVAVRDADEAYTNVKFKRINHKTVNARWIRKNGNLGVITVTESGVK